MVTQCETLTRPYCLYGIRIFAEAAIVVEHDRHDGPETIARMAIVEPSDQVLHDRGVEAIHDVLPMPFVRYETGVPERRQMMAERWFADVEMLRELPRVISPARSNSRMRLRVGKTTPMSENSFFQ